MFQDFSDTMKLKQNAENQLDVDANKTAAVVQTNKVQCLLLTKSFFHWLAYEENL